MLTVDMCSRKDGKYTAISWLLCGDNCSAIIVPHSCIGVYTLILLHSIKMALNTSRFLYFLNAVYTLGYAEISTSEMKYRLQVFMAGSVRTVVFCAVAVCNIVRGYCYRGTCCLHLQD